MESLSSEGGLIYTRDMKGRGISRQTLSQLAKKGVLNHEGYGVYSTPDDIVDNLYRVQRRCSYSTYSHDTALYLHGLSDRIPFQESITVPSGKSTHRLRDENLKIFYIKPELYEKGIVELRTPFGNPIRVYDAPRSVCDALRNRKRLESSIVLGAVKEYVHQRRSVSELMRYAKLLGVETIVRTYLEVLL